MCISRRSLLKSAGVLGASSLVVPSVARAQSVQSANLSSTSSNLFGGLLPARPQITHGVATGDVSTDGALVWTRADRPAHMIVEAATNPDFAGSRTFKSPNPLTPDTDGTGRLRLVGMEPGQQVHYRVHLEDIDTGLASEPVVGTFKTVPNQASDIRLHWSGDVVGQGWGINPDIGGMTGWSTMADRQPDLFIHSGDTCYADGPVEESVTLDDGRVWHNLTHPAKDKVAETLDEYRGQYQYNLLDENYRRFNSEVAQIIQWDDHETVNNWYPGEILDLDEYTEKDVDTLAARGYQAFHEWQPLDEKLAVDGRVYRRLPYGPLLEIFVLDMRTYKSDNRTASDTGDNGSQILGAEQKQWLIDAVNNSTATWKIIANDLPLGIVVPDGDDKEGPANGQPGAPGARETEIAEVLRGIKDVPNVVWLTADVHYTAAHHYSPDRASFQDFSPFWEFVSGPLNAGAFGPNDMDDTFGPEVVYVHAPGKDNANSCPFDEYQHFGEVDIDGETKEMTVRLMNTKGTELYTQTLTPSERG